MGIRAKFDVLVDHGFAQIDLKTIEAHIAPVVHLNHMEATVVFPARDPRGKLSITGNIDFTRRFHAQGLVRSGEVILLFPVLQGSIGIRSIAEVVVFQKLAFHGSMKPFDLPLRLRVLDATVDRQNIQAHQPLFKLRVPVSETGKLSAVV